VEIVGDSVRNHTYEEGTSNTEIAQDARVMDSQGSTVYMAMGGYAPETVARYKGRTAENAQWFRSLWYDLDVGESKDYKTLKEAGDALVSFVNTVGLPPPTLVHSGHGLHAYWPLDEDLPIADWRTAASKFMALAHQHGLRIDTTCTADAARILRPIGTHNYKAEPKLVSLIQRNNAVPFTQLQTYLASVKVATTTLVRVNGNHPKSKPIDAFGLGSIDKARPENFSASKIIAGCLQFQWALNNQPDVKEPVWRAMIGTLYRTDDPQSIHAFSNKHPGYTFAETEAKAMAWAGGGVTCSTLESMRPGGCAGCAKYGVIKSPSSFGLMQPPEIPPTKIDETTGMPENWLLRGTSLYLHSDDGPQLLYNGVISFDPPFKEKDPLSKNDVQYLPLHATTPMDRHTLFLHMGAYASPADLRKAFTTVGILPEPRMEKEFYNGMRSWIQKITDESTSVKPVRQMGWQSHEASDTAAGFVLGTTLYTPGKKQTVRIDSNAEKHARHMKQEGSLDEWKTAINMYSRPEYSAYALMSWLMFGAPLARLLGVGLPIAHFNSQGSGHGKTGTQDLLLSGAGNPRDPNGRWTGNTTIISIYAYLTAMNGNVAILDETSAIQPETLGKLMFEATLGSGRKAMAGPSGQTRDLPPITGLLVTSGNVSLQQLAQTMKGNSEAQVARVFEFNVKRPELTDDQRYADAKTFEKVNANYGHAMPIFIEHIVNHQANVKIMLAEIERKMIARFGMNNEERFWRALMTVSITGAIIAKQLGLIDHNVSALLPAAFEHYKYQRATLEEEKQSDNPLQQYVQDNQPSLLTVSSDVPVLTSTGMKIVTAVRKPAAHSNVRMRYAEDTGHLHVDKKHLQQYCSEKNYDFRQLLADAAKGNWLVDQSRRDLAVYTSLDTHVRVQSVTFDMVKAKAVTEALTKKGSP
jgi:hypothetical protein